MNNRPALIDPKDIVKAWKPSGLLEGADLANNRALTETTAVMLENQRLFNELATDSSDISAFKRISIPLIRRIFPQLIANKIVSVQPLLGPTGLVYYLRFRYSSNKGAIRGATNNSGYPGDDPYSLQQRANGNVNLEVSYASQEVQNETSSVDDGADSTSVFSPLEHTPVIPGSVTGVVYDGTTAIQSFTISEAGTFVFSDIGTPSPKATAGTLNVTTGDVTLTWNSAPGANHVVASYQYNMECNADMPEINLVVENEEILARTKKLKAAWTFEGQQDLRSQHNLDMENELTSVLAQEINLEIDREILTDLRNNAGTVAAWDYNTALGDTVKEKYEALYIKCTEVSNVIHRKTLRGSANWIVTSPEVASIFETATAGYAPTPAEGFTMSLGVQYVGSVNKKWTLYKDPQFPSNQLLMGYKGNSYMDSGFFFCPYVPLVQTPVVLDPETLCPRKGLMTRFGKKLLREGSKFYARLSIANFAMAG